MAFNAFRYARLREEMCYDGTWYWNNKTIYSGTVRGCYCMYWAPSECINFSSLILKNFYKKSPVSPARDLMSHFPAAIVRLTDFSFFRFLVETFLL